MEIYQLLMEKMVPFLQSHYKKILLVITLSIFLTLNFLPQTEKISQEYIDSSLKRAVVSFTMAKGLNAIISVAQGTEVAATPAGIGVNFAVGEVLDPINDMVERFSWVMLASSVSLGIQKILLSMLSTIWIQTIIALLALSFLYGYFRKKDKIASFSLKILLFLMILRFAMPFFALSTQSLYQAFLSPSYTTATTAIEATTQEAQALQGNKNSENLSLWGKVKKAYQSTKESLNIKKQINNLTQKLNDAFTHMLTLITLFIIETIIFPLLFLYLFFKLIKTTGISRQKSDEILILLRDRIIKPSQRF
jgi:hypothetical protein